MNIFQYFVLVNIESILLDRQFKPENTTIPFGENTF